MILQHSDIGFEKGKDGKEMAVAYSGLMFHEGKTVYVRFEKPRQLHYVVDHRRDFSDKFREIGLPTPEHALTDTYTRHKDIADMMLRDYGVRTPRTRTLIADKGENEDFLKRREWEAAGESRRIVFMDTEDDEIVFRILAEIREFLAELEVEEGVIKPNSGGGGYGVTFLDEDLFQISALSIMKMLGEGLNVALQERIITPKVVVDGVDHDWNLRVFVSLDENGEPVIGDMVVRIGESGDVINISQGSGQAILREVGEKLGWSEVEIRQMRERIETESIKAYWAITEGMREDGILGPEELPSDFMGIDIIIGEKDGEFLPYVMEVNNYFSGAIWVLDNHLKALADQGIAIGEERIGQSVRPWVDVMERKARNYKLGLREDSHRTRTGRDGDFKKRGRERHAKNTGQHRRDADMTGMDF